MKEIELDEIEIDEEFKQEIFDFYIIVKSRDYNFRDYFKFLISINDTLFKYMDDNKESFREIIELIDNDEEEFEF